MKSPYAMGFVSGPQNSKGLRLNLHYDHSQAKAFGEIAVSECFLGWPGVVHGGVLAALLEEVMALAAVNGGNAAQAVELEQDVSFSSPLAPGELLVLSGQVTARNANQANTWGEARRKLDQSLVASAHGVYQLKDAV